MILQETECLFVWEKHFAAPVSLELFQQRESEGTTNLVMFGKKVLFLSFCYPMFVMTINKLDIIWLSNISLHLGQLWLLCQMQGWQVIVESDAIIANSICPSFFHTFVIVFYLKHLNLCQIVFAAIYSLWLLYPLRRQQLIGGVGWYEWCFSTAP